MIWGGGRKGVFVFGKGMEGKGMAGGRSGGDGWSEGFIFNHRVQAEEHGGLIRSIVEEGLGGLW